MEELDIFIMVYLESQNKAILIYFLISRHCCSVARLVVGEPDVGLVLQSKAAAKQSRTTTTREYLYFQDTLMLQ